jgi:hypothetical protein
MISFISLKNILIFLIYYIVSMVCGMAVSYYVRVMAIDVYDSRVWWVVFNIILSPFLYIFLSFVYVYVMKWMIDRFILNRGLIFHAITAVIIFQIIFFCVAFKYRWLMVDFDGNIILRILAIMPAYTIALSGCLFLFIRWPLALIFHFFVFMTAFGHSWAGMASFLMFLPINVAYYTYMVKWSIKTLQWWRLGVRVDGDSGTPFGPIVRSR